MKTVALLCLFLISVGAHGQKVSFEKSHRAWSLGVLGGVAEGLSRKADDPRAVQFHQSVDFAATGLNLALIGANFSGWREKTKRQRWQTVRNVVLYSAIGLGSRSLAIKYSTQIGKR